MPLDFEIDAIVCDLLGTFFDETGSFEKQLGDRLPLFFKEQSALLHEIVEGKSRYRSYAELSGDALQKAGHGTGSTTDEATDLYSKLEAWPDARAALDRLRGLKLMVGLTNGPLGCIGKSCLHSGLAWHVLLSTSLASTYKPHPDAYALPQKLLSINPARCLFVAAHPWDLRGAQKAGYRTAFIKRPDNNDPVTAGEFDLHLKGLDELVEAIQ